MADRLGSHQKRCVPISAVSAGSVQSRVMRVPGAVVMPPILLNARTGECRSRKSHECLGHMGHVGVIN